MTGRVRRRRRVDGNTIQCRRLHYHHSMKIPPLGVVSIACNLAFAVVLLDTRVELSARRDTDEFTRRGLLDYSMVESRLQNLGSRLAQVEHGQDPPTGETTTPHHHQVTNSTLRDHVSSIWSEVGLLQQGHRNATVFMQDEIEKLKLHVALLDERVNGLLVGSRDVGTGDAVRSSTEPKWRRAQGAAPTAGPDPSVGENVKIIKRSVVRCDSQGSTAADGTFDYSQCADSAFATCNAVACMGHTAGHRRAQSVGTCGDLTSRTEEITAECCDEPSEDCTGGYPHTCNSGCAALFLPFWDDCRSLLGESGMQFEPVVALCRQANEASASLAEQLNIQCSDGTPAADCVPECSASLHGYLLLLGVGGDDSKLSCEQHHGQYSWVGASADGGYIGEDPQRFVSAVHSAAPGLYALALAADAAGSSQSLSIQSGQQAAITGLASTAILPMWGDESAPGDFQISDLGQ